MAREGAMETWEDAVLYGLVVAGAVALSNWFHLGFIGVLIAVALAGWLIQRRVRRAKEQTRELLRLRGLETTVGY
jgi:membrane protein implicated in regulation of membrane protease activity